MYPIGRTSSSLPSAPNNKKSGHSQNGNDRIFIMYVGTLLRSVRGHPGTGVPTFKIIGFADTIIVHSFEIATPVTTGVWRPWQVFGVAVSENACYTDSM